MNLRELQGIARRLMIDAGFEPDPPPAALAQVRTEPPAVPPDGAPDLRDRLWSSIDNEQSRDLDQIEWAERRGPGRILVSIGIADVDVRVPARSPVDEHAGRNTTSVYLGVATFPMLPLPLSEDLSSLLEGEGVGRLELTRQNRAREIVGDLMLAANTALAGYLEGRGLSSLRRVVRSPRRWDRIVAIAAAHGETLPPTPDAPALAAFLSRR